MKKIAILSNYQNSFSFSREQKFAYSELTRIFRENWLDLRRVSMHSFDRARWEFTDYIDIGIDGEFKIFHKEYRPDIVWNRSSEMTTFADCILREANIRFLSSSKLTSIESDKYEMYCFLKEFQPYTLLLKDFFTYPELRKNLSDRVVLKPIRSNSGKWILFPSQTELLEKKASYEGLESLFIVQEFLDFHEWVPWLVEGIHDVRLVYIGWKYSHATLRTPAKGSLKSNVWSGWVQVFLKDDLVPDILFEQAENAMNELGVNPEEDIISFDFWYVVSKNQWYLIEINVPPGLTMGEWRGELYQWFTQTYFPNLAHFFKSQC
jgi:glutathione synthase/RimK-type ligase-like ATP-grasp enzyme